MSQAALAKLVHVHPDLIAKVEKAVRRPTEPLAVACDTALGADGGLVALWTDVVCERDATVQHAAASHIPGNDQRLQWAVAHPRRLDRVTIESLAAVLAQQRRLEDTIGSAPLVPPVAAQMQTVVGLLRETMGPLRPALAGVAAQWGQYLGWLHTACGDWAAAEAWFGRALGWSVEAGETDLVATVLSFKGHLAWLGGQVSLMVGLTEAALRQRGVYIGQRAYDALQDARGHAVAGDTRAVAERVSQSRDLAEQSAECLGEVPPWHYYRLPWFFALERGRVYRYLGNRVGGTYNSVAIAELRSGLGEMPAEMRGADWAGTYLCDLAVAYAQDGDLAEAQTALAEVSQVADVTGSGELTEQVRRLQVRLQPDQR